MGQLYYSHARLERKKKARDAARVDRFGNPTVEENTRLLLRVDPDWGPIVRECLLLARQSKPHGKFAGAWVMNGLRAQGIKLPNNLRTLAKYGIIINVGTARGGKRAYYTLADPKGTGKALKDLGF